MNAPLRAALICLVLLDLGFVHITEGASPEWLLPLVALTIASPLLLPLRRYALYRIAWNGAVVGVFALLVHHATSGGVRYMLEDGLLLAALCQVHLLNNIGPDQKPDLLFFNSFLIPVVTCFLSMDLKYLVLFLVYAPVLLLGLSLHVLAREERPWSRELFLAVGSGAAGRALVVTGLTLLVFFFFPRDFHRKGLLGDRIRFEPGTILTPGFSEEVNLERSGMAGGGGDRIVMTVRLVDGHPERMPQYWRGATLGRFDGREWHPVRAASDPDPWRYYGGEEWIRRGTRDGVTVDVQQKDARAQRIFLPPDARMFRMAARADRTRVRPLGDRTALMPGGSRRAVRYRVATGADGAVARAKRRSPPVYSLILTGTIPVPLQRKVRELRKQLPPREAPERIVERFRAWLEASREYVAPGASGGARSLKEFVTGEAGGHCEFFATALVLMVRSEGIPARFVAGYRSVEWADDGKTLIVRDRHAHAWVEVLDPERGWYTVDATPPADADAGGGGGPIAAVGAFLRDLWDSVTGFDRESRAEALRWLADLPSALLLTVRGHPVLMGVLGVLLAAALGLRRRRRREAAPVRNYRRAVRQIGLVTRPGETPRELLLRARLLALSPKRLRIVERATEAHEAARYATR